MHTETRKNQFQTEVADMANRYLALLQTEMNILETAILKEPNQHRSEKLKSYEQELRDVMQEIQALKDSKTFGSKQLYGLYNKGTQIVKKITAESTSSFPLEVIHGTKKLQSSEDETEQNKKIA
jgi:Mg2+ and Co2+ transporter CorA